MLPIGKSVDKFDEGNICDRDDFDSSSSNMDFFEEDETDSFDLFDGLLDKEIDNKCASKKANDKVHSVVRVFPNGDIEEKQINFATLRTYEEKELVNYLGNGSRGRHSSISSASRKRMRSGSDTKDDMNTSSEVFLKSTEGACMSKSAIAARENRKKKKMYTQELETTVEKLQEENTGLKTKNSVLQTSLDQMETEVRYLKSVIANQTTLAHLISNIQNTPGVKFQTSLAVDRYNKENIKDVNENSVEKTVRVPVETKSRQEEFTQIRKKSAKYGQLKKDASTCMSTIKSGKKDDQCTSCPSSTILEYSSSEKEGPTPAGVCLHVSDGAVSFEFCAKCASSAAFAKAITCDHSYGKVQGEG
ncbi:uncharacterized protein LOC132550813 [Ylistrum balloti]|uniref:uncharacterized protein LOC132550813 n=1 Tax=Ylistrum balloti TaxID=509963 RepID=UPI002905BD0B|nr:uncharacterized protein LOC132550813 [Ylistrum balloti]XP_060070886.1 uncharacterized protein LOC132550813 [Ylistrum balloti]